MDPAQGVPHFGATVTVLFTDVESSSELLERLGQARWLEMLSEYESVLRSQLAAYGGREIKAMGDGHIAAFSSARAGLRCAVAIQRALPLPGAPTMRVRMGLHVGEPAARDDDLRGRTMVKAARIAGLARGGEVLASRLVCELGQADDEVGDDIWFDDERDVELRGLRGRHAIASVLWERDGVRPLSVVVADDSAVIRDGVTTILCESGMEVKAAVADADALYAEVERHRPDVVVTDIRMPPTWKNEGLVAAERIGQAHPDIGVLVLSQHLETGYALQLVHDRAERRGYLLKDRVAEGDVLLDAVRRVARGECVIDPSIGERLVARAAATGPLGELTAREREVLGLIAEGLSNRAIAERLVVSIKTVEAHVGRIFLELGLREETHEHRRVAAVLTYLRATSEG